MRFADGVSNFIFAIRTLPRWMLVGGGVLFALMAVVVVGLVAGSGGNKAINDKVSVTAATAIPISTSVPPTAAPKSDQLRKEKYRIVGSEIYEASLRNDSARVLQLCRQMDTSLQDDQPDESHDHNLLVDPCNLVVRGNSALSISSQIAAVIPASEVSKQETVVAIDVKGVSDNAKSSYRISYQLCSADPAGTIKDSGTTSPEGAARWMSQTWVVGPPRDGGYQGCLDGLLGKPSKLAQ